LALAVRLEDAERDQAGYGDDSAEHQPELMALVAAAEDPRSSDEQPAVACQRGQAEHNPANQVHDLPLRKVLLCPGIQQAFASRSGQTDRSRASIPRRSASAASCCRGTARSPSRVSAAHSAMRLASACSIQRIGIDMAPPLESRSIA